jgi:hypothetical protein
MTHFFFAYFLTFLALFEAQFKCRHTCSPGKTNKEKLSVSSNVDTSWYLHGAVAKLCCRIPFSLTNSATHNGALL